MYTSVFLIPNGQFDQFARTRMNKQPPRSVEFGEFELVDVDIELAIIDSSRKSSIYADFAELAKFILGIRIFILF